MHAVEASSFAVRIAGRITNRKALGTTLAQTIYTFSRFFLILFLPSLGFIVESGVELNKYFIIVSITFFLTFLVTIFIITKINSIQRFYQVLFHQYQSNTIPIALLKTISASKSNLNLENFADFSFDKLIIKKTFVSFLAYIFLSSGFFLAFMLAVLFPENRLTLSQFTALFHGFGAIIFSFYLDPMLSRSIDLDYEDSIWVKNIYSILIGRALSYLLMLFIFLILIFVNSIW